MAAFRLALSAIPARRTHSRQRPSTNTNAFKCFFPGSHSPLPFFIGRPAAARISRGRHGERRDALGNANHAFDRLFFPLLLLFLAPPTTTPGAFFLFPQRLAHVTSHLHLRSAMMFAYSRGSERERDGHDSFFEIREKNH